MTFIRHLILFIKNNFTQLRRKWLSLPLLLLFPVIMVTLIITIAVALIIPAENDPIQIGIVNLDESDETKMIVQLITESSELGSFIHIDHITASEATKKINNNQIDTYITFPNQFTQKLYEGESVSIPIVGNPNQPTESYVVKEIIESMTRHISAAQASILTINHYAKELEIDYDERQDMLFEQFKDFLLYTIGKDKIVHEQTLSNHATTSPVHYYAIATWFIIVMTWILLLYNFLYKEETIRMKQRMTLYGVTEMQQIFARMFVTLIVTLLLAISGLILLDNALSLELYKEDYMRILLTLCMHSIIFLECLAIIDTMISSYKLRLLLQSLLTFSLIILSGAIIPTSYFPLQIQAILPYLFSYLGLYWVQEVILNERLYVNFQPLLWMGMIGLVCFACCSFWKERTQS